MAKRYNIQIYQDVVGEDWNDYKYNPIYRALGLSKSFSGLNVDMDSAMMGFYECPFEIAQWIDSQILFPIQNGSLTLEELFKLSDGQIDLGAYNLKLYIREIIEKKGKVVDNWTEDRIKRNLEP